MPITKNNKRKNTTAATEESTNSPNMKKQAVLPKTSFKFTHTCKLITPSEIEVVLDLQAMTMTFASPVSVVLQAVKHTGVQPPKTFERKDGNGNFDKPAGTSLLISEHDKANQQVIRVLDDLNSSIARHFEEAASKYDMALRFYGRPTGRDGKDADSKIIDLNFTKSELQIAGRLLCNKAGFKGHTELNDLRIAYLNENPNADPNIMVMKFGEVEYITHIVNAKEYYDGIYNLVSNRLPEPSDWKYATFGKTVISVACNLVGSKVWLQKESQLYQVQPNMYLDKIRVFLPTEEDDDADDEISNGDNAQWGMRFFSSKITAEHKKFLEDNM